MNDLTVFDFEGSEIRTIRKNDDVWFSATDVATQLGLSNTTVAISKLDEDERSKFNLGRQGQSNFISEPGLYKLIGSSRKPQAKRFNRWVTHEVLPSIRQGGAYVTANTAQEWLDDPDMMISVLEKYRDARNENETLKAENAILQPKALFTDMIEVSKNSILIRQFAKLLRQKGLEIGQNRLFEWLRNGGWLIKGASDRNAPTQKAMEMGLFEVKETPIWHKTGECTIQTTTKITGKGQIFFMKKLMKEFKGVIE